MAVLKKKTAKTVSKRSVSVKKVATPKKVATVKKGVVSKKKDSPVKTNVKPLEKSPVQPVKKGLAKAKAPVATPKQVRVPKKSSAAVLPVVAVVETTRVVLQKKVIPVASKPSAQTCPLVLDGIMLEEDFSPRDCFSCDEFDCRFYSAEERSGPLGSRLFAGGEDEEEGDEWGLFDEDGEDPGEADDWGDTDDE